VSEGLADNLANNPSKFLKTAASSRRSEPATEVDVANRRLGKAALGKEKEGLETSNETGE
jgi:hypothetical protein